MERIKNNFIYTMNAHQELEENEKNDYWWYKFLFLLGKYYKLKNKDFRNISSLINYREEILGYIEEYGDWEITRAGLVNKSNYRFDGDDIAYDTNLISIKGGKYYLAENATDIAKEFYRRHLNLLSSLSKVVKLLKIYIFLNLVNILFMDVMIKEKVKEESEIDEDEMLYLIRTAHEDDETIKERRRRTRYYNEAEHIKTIYTSSRESIDRIVSFLNSMNNPEEDITVELNDEELKIASYYSRRARKIKEKRELEPKKNK